MKIANLTSCFGPSARQYTINDINSYLRDSIRSNVVGQTLPGETQAARLASDLVTAHIAELRSSLKSCPPSDIKKEVSYWVDQWIPGGSSVCGIPSACSRSCRKRY